MVELHYPGVAPVKVPRRSPSGDELTRNVREAVMWLCNRFKAPSGNFVLLNEHSQVFLLAFLSPLSPLYSLPVDSLASYSKSGTLTLTLVRNITPPSAFTILPLLTRCKVISISPLTTRLL